MEVLNIFHVLVAIAMVAFILVQKGAGATAGAAFGSGASGTVFGSRGASSFLSRATWILAGLFCVISLTMAVLVSRTLSAPETDLGVVGAPAAVDQQIDENVTGTPALDDSSQESDVPVLDTSANAQESGDLPIIEHENPGSPEPEESSDSGG